MKSIYKSLGMLAVVLILSTGSCNEALTTDSSVDVTGAQITGRVDGLEKILRAGYNNFLHGEHTYGGSDAATYVGIPGLNLYYDISGEDIMATHNNGISVEDSYEFSYARAGGSRSDRIWRMYYTVINQANTVLDYLPDASGAQAAKDALEGQSKAMRAICYFHIVMTHQQTYALAKAKRGVILRTSLIDQPIDLGFSTVEETYAQIVKDLTEAKTLLAGFNRSEKWQLNADVATGYLARVYQVMQNWQGALTEASALYSKYNTLMTKEQWCGGHCDIEVPEIIWAVVNTSLSNNGEETPFCHWYNQDPSYGEGMMDGPIYSFQSLLVDQNYVDLFDNTDYRGTRCDKRWIDDESINFNHVTDADEKGVMFWHRTRAQERWREKWTYNKFKYYGPLGDDGSGTKAQHNYACYSILRSSEMLLIKAEAEANLNNSSDALASLNTLQTLREAQPTTTTDKNALLEAIYVERRKELLGEGVTGMYDLLRLQKDLIRHVESATNPSGHFTWGLTNLDEIDNLTGKMPSNDYRYICQIPLMEFTNNSATDASKEQNPPRGQ
jgi:hypothetical protein